MSRTAAAKAVASSIDEDLAGNGLVRYRLAPPSWQAPWLLTRTAQESGYPQFFPTAIGQEEDQLTESAIKSGFIGKAVVQTETFSAHQLIYEKLKGETILPALAALAAAVAERAKTYAPSIAPSAFRLPSRVTATEAKKNAWTADLANPAIALSKISRNIPHGYRGEKLLDMVYALRVPLDRAVWCIRAIGGTEVQPQKARPGFSMAQYTYEWTTIVLEFLSKQLVELAPPTAAVATMDNAAFRATWTARFSYSRQLIAALYKDHLLDREVVLNFLVQQIDSSNSSQLPFILLLLQEYLDEFLASELLAARMVAACFKKLLQIESADSIEMLDDASLRLVTILRSTFISLPDAFIANPLWALQSDKLTALLLRSAPAPAPTIMSTILADLADLSSRRPGSSSDDDSSLEAHNYETIRLLDEIAFPSSISNLHRKLFHNRGRKRTAAQELPILFAWAISPDRSGSYRVYAVGKLIAIELASPSGSNKVIDVEAAFINWIDTESPKEWRGVSLLLAELVRMRVVSYSSYLHRMIARGETEAKTISAPSLHLSLLRSVALYDEPGLPIPKRRSALRAPPQEGRDLAQLVAIVEAELEQHIPGIIDPTNESTSMDETDCSRLLEVVKQVSEIGGHLAITRETIPNGVGRLLRNSSFAISHHSILVEVFLTVSDYYGLSSYLVLILQYFPARPLALAVLDTIEAFLDVWTAMGSLPLIGAALYGAHESLRSNGINDRRIVELLRQLGKTGQLGTLMTETLEENHSAFLLSLSSGVPHAQRLASNLPELHGLLSIHSPASIAQVATTLWYRYHSYENWGIVVFEAAIQLLPTIPLFVIANLLQELHERLPAGLDGVLEKWIENVSENDLVGLLGGGIGSSLVEVLSVLTSEGHITGSVLLGSFIVPAMEAILKSSSDRSIALRSTLELLSSLIGASSPATMDRGPTESSSTNLFAKHRASSRNATLYTLPNLPLLGRLIALLHVQQALTPALPKESLDIISRLLEGLCGSSAFRTIVAKDPQRLASAMLESSFAKEAGDRPSYCSQILVGLLSCLKHGKTDAPANLVSREDWDVFLSSLTIWRLATSKVEVQACLQALDLDQSLSASKKQEALHNLSRHFLDRVCLSGGETYLGEQVVRCYHGKASDELVSVAFTRLADAIGGLSATASPELYASSLAAVHCTGRLLNTLLQSGSASSRSEPLVLLLTAVRDWIARTLEEDDPSRMKQRGEAISEIANVVDIALRCAGSRMVQALELCRDCVAPAAGIALKYATASPPNLILATTLLDTVSRLLLTLSTLAPTLRLPSLQSILLSTAQHSIPDTVLSRLIRQLSPFSDLGPGIATVPSAWEMVDHADPAAVAGFNAGAQKPAATITNGVTKLHNIAPLDLAAFSAKVVEVVPSVTAMNAPSPSSIRSATPTSTPGGSTTTTTLLNPIHSNERGLQTNFDSETSCVGISILARNYRRTLISESVATITPDRMTRSTPTSAKKRARPDLTIEDSPPASTYRSSGSTTQTTAATGGRGAKRKDPPEVLIIDSDDEKVEAAPARAPPPKRGRTSSKTTVRGGKGKKRGG